jgi:flagella basal body P-ring formation protein FlgA
MSEIGSNQDLEFMLQILLEVEEDQKLEQERLEQERLEQLCIVSLIGEMDELYLLIQTTKVQISEVKTRARTLNQLNQLAQQDENILQLKLTDLQTQYATKVDELQNSVS